MGILRILGIFRKLSLNRLQQHLQRVVGRLGIMIQLLLLVVLVFLHTGMVSDGQISHLDARYWAYFIEFGSVRDGTTI